MHLDLHVNVFVCLTPPELGSFIPFFSLFPGSFFLSNRWIVSGDLVSVAEAIGLRQGHVGLKLQGAECQSRLFSFQPRRLKNFKGGRDSRRGRLTQTEKLCFPSHFKNTLNLWSGLNPSPSSNYRDDFARTSCSGHSVQPSTASGTELISAPAAVTHRLEVWGQCAALCLAVGRLPCIL